MKTEEHALSNISLRWMIEQIMDSDCPIVFDFYAFDKWHIPRTIGQNNYSLAFQPNRQGASASEDEPAPAGDNATEDKQDAVQKITDELRRTPLWWILENLPTYQSRKGKWVTTWW